MTPPNEEDAAYQVVKATADSILEPVKESFAALIGSAATEIGQLFGDYARLFRFRQTLKIFKKLERICDQEGLSLHAVAPRVLLPTLNYASLESDNAMQEKWAALLANASTAAFDTEVPPSFPEILHQLSPSEARFLDRCFDRLSGTSGHDRPPDVLLLGTLPALIHFAIDEHFTEEQANTANGYDSFRMMVENAVRLGLLTRFERSGNVLVIRVDGSYANDECAMTRFGWHFVRACRAPMAHRKPSSNVSA